MFVGTDPEGAVLNERIGQLATIDFPAALISRIWELPKSQNPDLGKQLASIDQFFVAPA